MPHVNDVVAASPTGGRKHVVTPSRVGIVSYFQLPSKEQLPPLTSKFVPKIAAFLVGMRSHKLFAAAHGFTLLSPSACNASVDAISPASWAKIFLLEACVRHRPDIDVLLWADADMVFPMLEHQPTHRTIERLLTGHAASCSVTFGDSVIDKGKRLDTAAFGLPNAGAWLLRTKDAATANLLGSLARSYSNEEQRWCRFWEQDALRYEMKTSAAARAAVCVLVGRASLEMQLYVSADLRMRSASQVHELLRANHHLALHFTGGAPPFPPLTGEHLAPWMAAIGHGALWKAANDALMYGLPNITDDDWSPPSAPWTEDPKARRHRGTLPAWKIPAWRHKLEMGPTCFADNRTFEAWAGSLRPRGAMNYRDAVRLARGERAAA